MQLGPVRFLGTVLVDPAAVPTPVVTYVAQPLGMGDPTCLTQYRTRDTQGDHAAEMQREYSYRTFYDPRQVFRVVRWLSTRAWLSAERPRVVYD